MLMSQNPNILRTLRNGDFSLTRIIGEGTFGVTYEGFERHGRNIAAKLLKVETPPVIPSNISSLQLNQQIFYLQLQNSYITNQAKMKEDFSPNARLVVAKKKVKHSNAIETQTKRDFR